MRELYFKAWHKTTREVCEVISIGLMNRYVEVLPESELEGGNTVLWEFCDIELIFCTGLNYSNGRKILTGDKTFHTGHKISCVAEWNDKFACFAYVDKDNFDERYFYQQHDQPKLEYRGNIYNEKK